MKLVCGYIGNWSISYTTENDRRWSLEKLGHKVELFQENVTTAEQLLDAMPRLDLLLYSHTHDANYVIEGLADVFRQYRKKGIPTASVHLDRWPGLERINEVGKEASWFTEYFFTADGSPEAVKLYEKLGLKWHWLKPGVKESSCYLAEPNCEKYPHDIVFVGSKGYHPEWPERPRLVNWLAETYGKSFGHYGNDGIAVVREDELNELYASAKVCVGDSCFSNQTKNYWSDRVSETTGRGGFLLYPEVEGLDHPVVTYETGNFEQLGKAISQYLQDDYLRKLIAHKNQVWTKEHATYTKRSEEMLNTMFA